MRISCSIWGGINKYLVAGGNYYSVIEFYKVFMSSWHKDHHHQLANDLRESLPCKSVLLSITPML